MQTKHAIVELNQTSADEELMRKLGWKKVWAPSIDDNGSPSAIPLWKNGDLCVCLTVAGVPA